MDTTAGSTLARISWTSWGLVSALLLGKNCLTMVCWLLDPTSAPTTLPTRAATAALTTTTQIQVLRCSVWRTTGTGAGKPYG